MFDSENQEIVRNLVVAMDKQVLEDRERGRNIDMALGEIADQLASEYNRLSGTESHNRDANTVIDTRLSAFAKSVRGVEQATSQTNSEKPMTEQLLEQRMWSSDVLQLAYLLVTNQAQNIMEKTLRKQGVDVESLTPDEIADQKAEICVRFIKDQRTKNRELEMYQNPKAPTTGLEAEYIDVLRSIQVELSTLKRAIGYVEGKIAKCTDEAEKTQLIKERDGYVDKLMANREMRTLFSEVTPTNTRGSDEQDQDTKTDNLVKFLRGQRPLVEGDTLSDEEVAILMEMTPTRSQIVAEVSTAYDDAQEIKGREAIMNPSATYATQVRDLIHTIALGALDGKINIHQTVSDVIISPEQPEFMEVLPMCMTSGLIKNMELDPQKLAIYEKALKEDPPLDMESHKKKSVFKKPIYDENGEVIEIEEQEFYAFVHRFRDNGAPNCLSYKKDNAVLTELRGVGSFDLKGEKSANELIRFVKQTSFNWLCAWGCKADQMKPEERDTDDEYLAQCWRDLQSNWKDVLQNHGIQQPDKKDYTTAWNTAGTTESTERYTNYVTNIAIAKAKEKKIMTETPMTPDELLTYKKSTLTYQSYKIMVDYRAKVRARIKEMETRSNDPQN